ncbi:MAG: hypothetical protein WBC92_16355 [Terracidiphilus sp.]
MSISLDKAIWLAYMLIEAVVIGLLFYRRIWRTLPVFCGYCIWDLSSNIGAFLINRFYPSSYFHAYIAETIIDSVLQFSVLVELTWSLLRPLRASLSRSTLLVVAALILVAGAAIWPFAALTGIVHVTRSALLVAQLQQTMAILRILFFLLLAGGSQFLSIGWRDRELQVATGLGFYSLVSVAVSIFEAHQNTGPQYTHLIQFVVLGFLCTLLYWTFSFAQKEAARREFTPQMQSLLLAVAGAARSTRTALTEAGESKAPRHGGC